MNFPKMSYHFLPLEARGGRKTQFSQLFNIHDVFFYKLNISPLLNVPVKQRIFFGPPTECTANQPKDFFWKTNPHMECAQPTKSFVCQKKTKKWNFNQIKYLKFRVHKTQVFWGGKIFSSKKGVTCKMAWTICWITWVWKR